MTRNDPHSDTHSIATRGPRSLISGAIAVLLAAGGLSLLSGCGNASRQAPSDIPTTASTGGSVVARRGRALYQADGCAGCHSLNGTRLTGPTWKGLAGSTVTLTNGERITATAVYLRKHIIEPNAVTVRGYPAEVMAEAIETFNLKSKPQDVRALVAFIESLK